MGDESKAIDKCNSVPSRRVGILRRPDPETDDLKSYPTSEINLALEELTVPNATLRSSPKKNASKPKDNSIESKTKVNMDYWLKPTSVQVYPYKFFVAACKKLEAITNPVVRGKTDDSICSKKISKSSSKCQEISLENNLNYRPASDNKKNKSEKLESPISYNQTIPSLSTEGIESLKVTSKLFEQKSSNRQHNIKEFPFINSKRAYQVSTRPVTSFEYNTELPLITEDLNSSNAFEMLDIYNKGLSRAILDSRKLQEALSSSISALNRDGFAHKSPINSYPPTSVGYSSTFESLTESNDDPEAIETATAINSSENMTNTRNTENASKEEKTSKKHSTTYEQTVSDLDVNPCESSTGSRMTSNGNSLSNEAKSNNSNMLNESWNSTNVQKRNSREQILHKDYSFVNNVTIDPMQSKNINFSRGSDNESHIKFNSTNQSIGSEVFTVLNQTDVEFSMYSENTVSYSRIGLYECLINSENQKSKDLTTLLKLREKSLIDRTKGQIAWLELQKQKFKEKGLTAQISAVKKKQRAILVSLDKERASIHRTVKSQRTAVNPSTPPSMRINTKHVSTILRTERLDHNLTPPNQAIKGDHISVKPGTDIEALLIKRERELQTRRTHVEHLIRWHQRLDDEERAVMHLEKQLMNYSKSKTASLDLPAKQVQQIQDIERSITILQGLSNDAGDKSHEIMGACVHVSGSKLNKLWRRLTGEHCEKFDTQNRFKISKEDLEHLYEEAKRTVLKRFDSSIIKELEDSEIQSQIHIDDTEITDQNTCNLSAEPESNAFDLTKSRNNLNDSTHTTTAIEDSIPAEALPTIDSSPISNEIRNIFMENDSNAASEQYILSEIQCNSTNISLNADPSDSSEEKQQIEPESPKNLEQRLIDIDDSLKDINDVIKRSLEPKEQLKSADISNILPIKEDLAPCSVETSRELGEIEEIQRKLALVPSNNCCPEAALSERTPNKMPDIISEAEVLRCQLQFQPVVQLKISEQLQVINKPPPPYVPPAHGSPLTTIFPSNDRIADIVFRRMKELSTCPNDLTLENFKTPAATQKLSDENITNIFERIVLDICVECMNDLPSFSSNTNVSSSPGVVYKQLQKYKHPLAFYNPPDRLVCIQDYVLKRVKKLLGDYPYNSTNLNRASTNRSSTINKCKHDTVDEILVQEISEDDSMWTNFDIEKSEVLTAITAEILSMELMDALHDCQTNYMRKVDA